MTYLGALILGLFLPFALIYSIDLFDTKVHTREDIEKVLNYKRG
jgi:capsular polysaccharide biosynthesis protein